VADQGKEISIVYTLMSGGEEIENNRQGEPLTFVEGAQQILPALENALAGLAVGDTTDVTLAAADGYGEVNPEAIQEVELDKIPEGAREVGAILQAEGFDGPIRVTEVREDVAVLDFNHPLAGRELNFAIEIVAIS